SRTHGHRVRIRTRALLSRSRVGPARAALELILWVSRLRLGCRLHTIGQLRRVRRSGLFGVLTCISGCIRRILCGIIQVLVLGGVLGSNGDSSLGFITIGVIADNSWGQVRN